jgi:hypothetical protein
MITDILISLFNLFMKIILFLLPTWTIWPHQLLDGLTYFTTTISNFNFIVPIDSLFQAIQFVVHFEEMYLSTKLILKVWNYFRGTGSGLDI